MSKTLLDVVCADCSMKRRAYYLLLCVYILLVGMSACQFCSIVIWKRIGELKLMELDVLGEILEHGR